eukprot:scaffold1060_cov385-Pavlova_lutheri.AAC.29
MGRNKVQKNRTNYTAYERERDEHVRRNLERMEALGIPNTKREMEAMEKKRKKDGRKTSERKQVGPDSKTHQEWENNVNNRPMTRSKGLPSTRSNRSDRRDAIKREREFNDALGQFVVDGTCPKCERVFLRNHRNHLKSCTGKRRTIRSKEEDEAMKKEHVQRSASRMMQLLFNGVESFDGDTAKLSVIGSSGNMYILTFSDQKKRKCTCPDHRFRHRDCKHILLAMKVLGIEGKKEVRWKEATAQYIEEEGMGATRERSARSKKVKTEPMPRTKEETVAMGFL